MLYVAWMVLLGDDNIKKISFENFDFRSAQGEKLHEQVVHQSLGRTPPLPTQYGTVGGWWVRADLNVQRTSAYAQSATTWCGTELVYAAVQQAKH